MKAKKEKKKLKNNPAAKTDAAARVGDKAKDVRTKSLIREYIEVIIAAILLALFIRTFTVQAFKIPSGSMEPTLQVGDHIMVNKFIYGVRLPIINKMLIPVTTPQRGNIIVFIFPLDPSKDYIKRVVAVAGDTVEVRKKKLYINGNPVKDEHAYYDNLSASSTMVSPRDNFGPITVPEKNVFVMGDNRDHSYDSRFWGPVDLKAIRGKAFIIYWSWDSKKWRVRWNRLGHLLH
ncbi:MAG: signal peptidase I [Deltaproteobacteria bacterium]|nr:signal peptidase I [Deltaproteobacteria bacterium]MBW2052447.1 signal peptidase I [Deltaproteobacteria bacterium]MBW2140435.1 signal peptidase I [Deltaproteobacteria bacterium]MBW2322957.1 signal peptidase I [Deltaproteobacteria bacterium]